MYLLLVENNYISSREIKSLLENNKIDCEVINCSSSSALLEISERLRPDIVIIDFDFYINDSSVIVKKLRQFNGTLYIFAFVDPDHFEKLHPAIEMGIDDYMVKPLQREDMMLRIKMALRRKSSKVNKQEKIIEETEINKDYMFELSLESGRENRVISLFPNKKTPEEAKQIFSELADDFNKQSKVAKPESYTSDHEKETLTYSENEAENNLVQEYEKVTDSQDLYTEYESDANEVEDLSSIEISYFNSSKTDEVADNETIFVEETAMNEEEVAENDNHDLDDIDLDIKPEFQSAAQSESSEEKLNRYSVDETFFTEHLEMQNKHDNKNYGCLNNELPQPEQEIMTKTESKSFLNDDGREYLAEDSKLFGVEQMKKSVDTKLFEELFESREENKTVSRDVFSFLKTDASRSGNSEAGLTKPSKGRVIDKGNGASKKNNNLKVAGGIITASLLVVLITVTALYL